MNEQNMKPQLEVGQVWKRRDGETVKVLGKREHKNFPFVCSMGATYTRTGDFLLSGEQDSWDLIELVADAPAPEPHTRKPMTEHKPKLKVGQVWKRLDGEIVEIVRKEDHIYYPFTCSKANSYTEAGNFIFIPDPQGKPDPWDLIELVADAPLLSPTLENQ